MTLAWRPFRDTAALEAWGRQVGESLPPPAELARYREPYYWAAFALTATGR